MKSETRDLRGFKVLTVVLTSLAVQVVFTLPAYGDYIVDWGNITSVPGENDFIAISAFGSHSLALKSNGSIVGWGSNAYGKATPPGGNDYVAIAAGFDHSLALKADGSIVCWGRDDFGQATPPPGNDYVAIAAGGFHNLALKDDGSIVGWGRNDDGQRNVPAGNDFVAISAGGWHSLALKADGSIVAWGWNDYGQANIPAEKDFVAISAGGYHSLALKLDGSIVGWGHDGDGQATPPAGNDYVAIAAGGVGHNLALRSDGSIVAWGLNNEGQVEAPEGTNFTAIAAGNYYSLALVKVKDVVEDDFDDSVIDESLWIPSFTGSGQIEEADGVLKTSAPAGIEGWTSLDSCFELTGDFDVWVEYDWAMYDGSGDSRTQLRVRNTTDTELLTLNCHRWQSGTSREIIFSGWIEDYQICKYAVIGEIIPLSGKLRIKREGSMCYGYYWNSESSVWNLIGSAEAFETTVYVRMISNNTSNNFPNGAFEVHWNNFYAEADEINGLEPTSPPVADAGGPYLVAVNGSEILDGSGSSDPDGDTLTYSWTHEDEENALGIFTFNENFPESPIYTGTQAGITNIILTVSDGIEDVTDTTMVIVYNPDGGFVTGGGWIWSLPGSYLTAPLLEGKANFGFVAKYKKGATVPTGNTEFVFQTGELNFHSISYDWLVVTGSDYARFKGNGTINGSGDYKFMLWAGDSEVDTFRIKIWTEDELGNETVVYDNGFDQEIGGGSIIVHTK